MHGILKRIIFLSVIFSCFVSFSQDRVIDSLKRQLQNPKLHDTTRLYIIATLVDQCHLKDCYDTWNEAMGKLARENLKKNNTAQVQKKYITYLGVYHNNFGARTDNTVKACENFDKSIALFRSIKVYNEMSYALIGKGIVLANINEYQKALDCYFEALKYFERYNPENGDGISYAYSGIGAVYTDLKQYPKSIEYFKKSMFYLEKANDGIPEDDSSRSEQYVNCGSSYFLMKDYVQALAYFSKALSFSTKINDRAATSIILTKIGRVYIAQGKPAEAEKNLKSALNYSDNPITESNINIRLGELYHQKKKLKQAISYLDRGFKLAIAANSLALQEQASELLYQFNKEDRNFEKALEMQTFLTKIRDSADLTKNQNALERQQLKYSFEKREFNYKLNSQRRDAQKNNFLVGLSGLILLLIAGSFFWYRSNRQKQTIEVLEIKRRLLVTQMNPHFIFNSIDNIQSLIYNKQDQEAVTYLTKFSKLTRQILENSNENYIPLSEELAMIDNYLVIQQLLYNNAFDFSIAVEDGIEADTILLPPMLTQPFIENAIKHGIQNKEGRGMIAIRFSLHDSKLYFELTDNGGGFGASQKDQNHKSLAMRITKERLANYTKKSDFTVQAENVLDQHEKVIGAKVIFEIPYIYEN